MELFAVIMAGGIGSRFWPRSKKRKPKQLLRIIGENTMIQDTISRLNGIVNNENIIIITNVVQKERILEQLPHIPKDNIIAEPFGKNTAPAIGLAAVLIEQKCSDAVMLTLPADHIITDVKKFQSTLKKAVTFASKSEGLITIGIQPSYPETGYGYIQFDEKEVKRNIHQVLCFAEKPNLTTAKRFIKAGDFLWNSGMFVWKIGSILNEIKILMPDLYNELNLLKPVIGTKKFYEVLEGVYKQLRSISIDYGIMEKSKKVYLIPGNFGWSDLGSWDAVYQISQQDDNKNVLIGDTYIQDVQSSYIFSPKKFTAVIGMDNVIVINTHNALLICKREQSQEVKNIVEYLKLNDRKELL
jgi:mannose-1-phosphate guanylyltransferase